MHIAFHKSFKQQEQLPEEAIAAATRVMQHGRLHRYNTENGETAETAMLEQEFAQWSGARYCLSVATGGYAIACALRALGVGKDSPVLTNAFTLAPVPGAIASLWAIPIFVESTQDLVIDFNDLKAKIGSSGANVLLLSHMRGHICDMDQLITICNDTNVNVIEDCAHTMGAWWSNVRSGRHGIIACYSTQTYKHINSGEGGLLISDNDELMAKAVVLSGSYMFYDKHLSVPPNDVIASIWSETPNISGRMDNLRAALLRPQLKELDAKCREWNLRYRCVEKILEQEEAVETIARHMDERFVGSSIQFRLSAPYKNKIPKFIRRCAEQGVILSWFGNRTPDGYTSRYDNWSYCPEQNCPQTDEVLDSLIDMRLPLSFTLEDCTIIAGIICANSRYVFEKNTDSCPVTSHAIMAG